MQAAFNVSDVQAVKITRRVTGRLRFFQRAWELTFGQELTKAK